MRVTATQPAWGGNPTVMLSASAKRQTQKAQQNITKNRRPVGRSQGKVLTEDEKWVLEALYKRLPTF